MKILSGWYTSGDLLLGYPEYEVDSVVLNLEELMHDTQLSKGTKLVFPQGIYKLGRPYQGTTLNLDTTNWVQWTSA